MNKRVIGKVHSIQSLGTVDGPGVRYVVFLQGCNLRCKCCHNPDTWDFSAGREYTAEEIVKSAVRYKEYFGSKGGITLSGGEPLLQSQYVYEVFSICKQNGINTCLDTSGSILNEDIKKALSVTDRVLLDIKYTENALYQENVGCTLYSVLEFLEYLNIQNIPTILRQVIIPTVNDNEENIKSLKALSKKYNCVEKIELLPFRKICQVKYDDMKLQFPFSHIPEPAAELMENLKSIL
ncbi:MAG: pyruvate formate lyase-activating protein [Ruminococcaceae bacterium]|nr:pyruvate formate lyase-activating protein [Oscillospiraceae bacterium]